MEILYPVDKETVVGNKKSGRPGGNPELEKYQYQLPPKRSRPFNAVLSIGITPEIKAELLRHLGEGNVAAFCREAIFEKMRAEGMEVKT